MAQVLARLHSAGLVQNDPHIKNFLLSGKTVYAIDGDAVDAGHLGKELSYRPSLKNLGLFFAQFYPVYANLIPDAFKHYAYLRKWTPEDNTYNCLMKEIRKSRLTAEKEYLKKIFRESTHFVRDKNRHRFIVCDRDYYDDEMKAFFDNAEEFLSGRKILKDGNSSTVFLVNLSGHPVVVKRYNMKNMWHFIRRSCRKSRAWMSWKNAHLLKSMGINTPKPLAMMEKRYGPFRGVSYILNEYVGGADINHLLNTDFSGDAELSGLAKQLGDMLGRFAFSSTTHGDFKATNFILSDKKILFIADIYSVRKHKNESKFKKAFREDLSRFMQNWENRPDIDNLFRDEISKIKHGLF
jgi:tRNA A-37 threonylcarbamoyl transferase component Bud32